MNTGPIKYIWQKGHNKSPSEIYTQIQNTKILMWKYKEYTIEFQIKSWKRSGSESAPAASIHSWWAVHIAKKSTLADLILRFSEQKGDKNLLKIRFIFVQVISN